MRACLLALVLVSSFSSVALADDPAPATSAPHVTVMGTTHIVGRRQAPTVVQILSRARFRYRAAELDRRATDAIVESVTHPPF